VNSRERTDDELVAAAQGGDATAMDELLRRHYDRVHAVCRRIAGGSRDADDAAQEAMILAISTDSMAARPSRPGSTGSRRTPRSTSCASASVVLNSTSSTTKITFDPNSRTRSRTDASTPSPTGSRSMPRWPVSPTSSEQRS